MGLSIRIVPRATCCAAENVSDNWDTRVPSTLKKKPPGRTTRVRRKLGTSITLQRLLEKPTVKSAYLAVVGPMRGKKHDEAPLMRSPGKTILKVCDVLKSSGVN